MKTKISLDFRICISVPLIESFGNSIIFQHFATSINSIEALKYSRQFKVSRVGLWLNFSQCLFLSMENNMTIKQQINHGTIQNVCHLHNEIFHVIHLCYNFALSPPQWYSLKITNCGMREKKIFCLYGCWIMWQEVENRIFRPNHIFRHTCMNKQSILTK